MKSILWVVLFAVGTIVVVALIGWLLPRDHIAARMGRYQESPETIWAVITDVGAMPSWREGLKGVKKLPDRNGLAAHIEYTSMGELPLETVEMTPPRRLVVRIADAKLPFGGAWTYEISPAAGGATLRITENGFVSNPIFRFLSRFVFGYTGEIDKYLRSLSKKFGEAPQISD
jgi:Polyketide cyclase / dehydrase and lipid transport